MSRCSICSHAQIESINIDLLNNTSLEKVSEKYGISKTAVHRHKSKHMTGQLAKVQQAQLAARADSVMDKVLELEESAKEILRQAQESDSPTLALRAVKELRETISLIAKLTGELREAQTVITNNTLIMTPEWVSLRGAILRALSLYPEARQAVAAALGGHKR